MLMSQRLRTALPPFPLHTQRRSPALCGDTASLTVDTSPTPPFMPPVQASRADRPRPCTLGGCTHASPILPTP